MDEFGSILESLAVSTKQLKNLQDGLIKDMDSGLKENGKGLKMLPSFLYKVPTGNEKGTYIALDLGGTNFRVVQVDLLGNGQIKTEYLKYTIPDELKTGNGALLFDFIAECVKDFMVKQNVKDSKLGFTFSFPCQQLNINKAILMHWAKGFTAEGVEGKDVVSLLQEALKRNDVKIECVAVINDTVGTLLAHAYQSPNTKVGVILGTGTNAAYIEQSHLMKKDEFVSSRQGTILVNIEWGAFGDDGHHLPFTSFDHFLDSKTPKPNQQRFEKMVSGMYLGEIVRLVLIDLIKLKILFHGKISEKLNTPYILKTKYMSDIENDKSVDFEVCDKMLKDMYIEDSNIQERQIVKSIVQQVGTRSARLAGAALSGVLLQSHALDSNEEIVIAIDGSLFEHYPDYQFRIEAALRELLKDKAKLVKLELARDGSSVGAALGTVMTLESNK